MRDSQAVQRASSSDCLHQKSLPSKGKRRRKKKKNFITRLPSEMNSRGQGRVTCSAVQRNPPQPPLRKGLLHLHQVARRRSRPSPALPHRPPDATWDRSSTCKLAHQSQAGSGTPPQEGTGGRERRGAGTQDMGGGWGMDGWRRRVRRRKKMLLPVQMGTAMQKLGIAAFPRVTAQVCAGAHCKKGIGTVRAQARETRVCSNEFYFHGFHWLSLCWDTPCLVTHLYTELQHPFMGSSGASFLDKKKKNPQLSDDNQYNNGSFYFGTCPCE